MRKHIFNRRSDTRGSIAVEFAIMLPIYIVFLSTLVLFGRMLWHYTVAEKAARDAALFLSRVSIEEIRAPLNAFEIPVAALARAIAWEEMAELRPGESIPSVAIYCDGLPCDGFTTPRQISVVIRMNMIDPFFSGFLAEYGFPSDFLLTATAATNYVGG